MILSLLSQNFMYISGGKVKAQEGFCTRAREKELRSIIDVVEQYKLHTRSEKNISIFSNDLLLLSLCVHIL